MSAAAAAIEGLFGPDYSGWQANMMARCIVGGVAMAAALVFLIATTNALLSVFADIESTATIVELLAACACLPVALAFGLVFQYLYFRGYEIREEPVPQVSVPDRFGTTWQSLYADKNMAGSPGASGAAPPDDAERAWNAEVVAMYANEFFYNAMVNPRTVFSRISEHVSPGLKMLDCYTDYEVCPPEQRGVRIVGLSDYAGRLEQGFSCNLIVPISFLHRSDFAVRQDVSNAGDARFPRVKQSEVADHIASIIESYRFSNGHVLRTNAEWLQGLRRELTEYLLTEGGSADADGCADAPLKVYELMKAQSATGCDDDARFSQRMYYLLMGLRDVVPVCVPLHVVVLPSALEVPGSSSVPGSAGSFPRRVFNLRYAQKVEMRRKRADVVPNKSHRRSVNLLNRIMDRMGDRNTTVFYNLARAGRSTSYHLYLDGPEGTYYSRGSLVWDKDTSLASRGRIRASCVQMQRRYGQRHAHIYIRNGHCMSEVAFMFRYRKAPLDTSHLMFVATFLGMAVLTVCALTSVGALKDSVEAASGFSGFSVPAMVLAVATAAGPWVYNRASDGRGDSLGVEVAMLALTICSAAGIVLFFAVVRMGPGETALAVRLWSAVLAIMAVDMVFAAAMSLLHSVLYRRMLERSDDEGQPEDPLVPTARSLQFTERVAGSSEQPVRLDTPYGGYVRNAYGKWSERLRNCRIELQGDEFPFIEKHEL